MDYLKLKRSKGFSFVEITIVCVIMMILLIPIFTLLSRGSSGTVRNRNEILAQQYASNVITYCSVIPFDDDLIKTQNGKKTDVIGELRIKDIAEGIDDIDISLPVELGETASKTITVTDFNPTEGWPYKYKLVTVKVAWLQPGETKVRDITMTGLVSE